VSAALGRLAEAGHVRRAGQTWLLLGTAPDLGEFAHTDVDTGG
jgi:hypothetical protein